jgi:hypothetical protein
MKEIFLSFASDNQLINSHYLQEKSGDPERSPLQNNNTGGNPMLHTNSPKGASTCYLKINQRGAFLC